jgi:ADP-ribosylation factor 1/2
MTSKDSHGIIFVLDSANRDEMADVRQEFDNVINDKGLRQAIILILANKQDLPDGQSTIGSKDQHIL